MSKHAHILPFNQAKNPRSRLSSFAQDGANLSTFDLPEYESPFRSRSETSFRGSSLHRSENDRPTQTPYYPTASSYNRFVQVDKPTLSSKKSSRYSAVSKNVSSRFAAESRDAFFQEVEEGCLQDAVEINENGVNKKSRFVDRMVDKKRKQTKERAGKKFLRQYGGEDSSRNSSASEQDGAPRAAVYRGQMGKKQKQSVRLQRTKGTSLKGLSFPSQVFSFFAASNARLIGAVVCLIIVSGAVILYPSAQQYYQAVREQDRLQAEYAALAERNSQLEQNVSSLSTDAGVEQRAHEQFGWVKEGEQSAAVRGLNLDTSETSAFQANITPESIEAPETWYSPLLDTVFGVE